MNLIFSGSKTNTGYGIATETFKECFLKLKKINTDFYIFNSLNSFNKNKKYDKQFHIGPPVDSGQYFSDYRILYFYWETDKLPDSWSKNIKKYNEIWAPCNLVKEVCIKSGFNGTINIVPTPSMVNYDVDYINLKNKLSNRFINNDFYKFYSIFQWQPRKGYDELITSYFESFNDSDEVLLVIKTDPIKHGGEKEIINFIYDKKKYFNKKLNIFLISEYLKSNDIWSLHKSMDCFVLPHYGEGWGMPIHEASIFGNPIITTKYGGITDYINNNIYFIDHKMVSVSGMEWNNVYNSTQRWAKPNIESLSALLKKTFKNKQKKEKSFDKFSVNNVSNIIEGIL